MTTNKSSKATTKPATAIAVRYASGVMVVLFVLSRILSIDETDSPEQASGLLLVNFSMILLLLIVIALGVVHFVKASRRKTRPDQWVILLIALDVVLALA